MKKYSDYKYSSVSMSTDNSFISALDNLFAENNITNILESGTFIGLGSTTLLAEAILKSKKPLPVFVTIEVDQKLHKEAVKNLSSYEFIVPKWGLSVSSNHAKEFIKTDEAIQNHSKYPDVFIDDTEDPVRFYLDEINGMLSGPSKKTFSGKVKDLLKNSKKINFEEKIFETTIPKIKNSNPLFLLDSAGGLGFLEFQKVQTLMEGLGHFLILDDIHHLKHFRSYKEVCENKDYKILDKNIEQGWVIAKYSKTNK
ncbi:MAG: hypothetical protein M3P82_04635 [Bacteroidota bacterium]|nr:hypothetical protein [Bacteroidota bacterium]